MEGYYNWSYCDWNKILSEINMKKSNFKKKTKEMHKNSTWLRIQVKFYDLVRKMQEYEHKEFWLMKDTIWDDLPLILMWFHI